MSDSAFGYYRFLTSLSPTPSQCLPLRRHCRCCCHSCRRCSSSRVFIIVGVIVFGCHRRRCLYSPLLIVGFYNRARWSTSSSLIVADIHLIDVHRRQYSSSLFIVDSIHHRRHCRRCTSSSSSLSSSLSSDRRTRKSLLRLPRADCTTGNPSSHHPQHAHLLAGPHPVPSCLLCSVPVGGVSTSTLDGWWRQATLCSFYQKQLSVMHHLVLTVQPAPSHVHRISL